jgi:hypothetical protein
MAHTTESDCFTVIVILVGSVDAKLCVILHSVFGEKHTIKTHWTNCISHTKGKI